MLILKVGAGLLALISAAIIFYLERKPKSLISFEGAALIFFVASSGGYIYSDYRDEADKQASELEFRNVMTEISKDILKSSHPYHPKEVRFDYCFDMNVFMSMAQRIWKTDTPYKAFSAVSYEREKAFREMFGSSITLIFTKDSTFRDGPYRDLDHDKANLLLEPHQATAVGNYTHPMMNAIEAGSDNADYCQEVIFSIPEIGFNAFDAYNAVHSRSYYDLSGTNFFIYLKASTSAQQNGVASPRIKNLSIAFGNGVRKFYLRKGDDVKSVRYENGIAYRQASGISAIETDYPSISGRFESLN